MRRELEMRREWESDEREGGERGLREKYKDRRKGKKEIGGNRKKK